MGRGPKKHQKRVAAPSHWMLGKLTGVWAPRPSSGPYKIRECLPLCVLLRNRLKYALNYKEAKMICVQRLVKIDGKVRTDHCFPAGFMDVVSLEKTKEHFRLLYDTKGRFVIHKISDEEATYKMCRVQTVTTSAKGVASVTTHDGRTVRYADPEIATHDSVRIDIATGKVLDFVKFTHGNIAMIMGGNSMGRVGVIGHREKHPGNWEMIHLRDASGNEFATRVTNVMVIGKDKSFVSLPKGDGIKKTIIQDRHARMAKN